MDWQIIEEDEEWLQESLPVAPPKRRVSRRLVLALASIPFLAVAVVAAYIAWTYRTELSQATAPVQEVARAELQAVAQNDQVSFMALQDPEDAAWRASQVRAFGRLQNAGLPQFGWRATDIAPQIGHISLEPGGALLNVTYQFAVAQPMPGGPVTVTLQVSEFFKPTSSGWVHAMPGADVWGPERSKSGKHVTVLYHRLDANVVEPLIPHMDDLVAQLCASLPCSSKVSVVFDNTLGPRWGFFYRGQPAMVRLPSPYLLALPTDANSRDELYRAFETQLVRMMVYQAFGRDVYMNRQAGQQIMQWELARVGLVGPLITDVTRHTLAVELQAGVLQPLAAIPLHSSSFRLDTSDQAMMSFAFAFLDRTMGAGTVERLIPAAETSMTLGDAISTALHVDPKTLEKAWQQYLLEQAGLVDRALG